MVAVRIRSDRKSHEGGFRFGSALDCQGLESFWCPIGTCTYVRTSSRTLPSCDASRRWFYLEWKGKGSASGTSAVLGFVFAPSNGGGGAASTRTVRSRLVFRSTSRPSRPSSISLPFVAVLVLGRRCFHAPVPPSPTSSSLKLGTPAGVCCPGRACQARRAVPPRPFPQAHAARRARSTGASPARRPSVDVSRSRAHAFPRHVFGQFDPFPRVLALVRFFLRPPRPSWATHHGASARVSRGEEARSTKHEARWRSALASSTTPSTPLPSS